MKYIKYQVMVRINRSTEEDPKIEQRLYAKGILCSEADFETNYAIAKAEAYNGEVTVEDIEDPITEPTQLDQIEAQVTYTALMTDTLLDFEEE